MAIHSEIHDGIGLLTLDRPEKANAYDREHLESLESKFAELSQSTNVVVVRATGKAFCAGADLTELGQAAPMDALDLYSQRVFEGIATSPTVSIATVAGPAIAGGFELALACDLRVVSSQARFELPETRLGLIPAAGGTTRLTQLVGPGRAREVILAGRVVDAPTALVWGIATKMSADPEAAALELARAVAKRDPVALSKAKQVMKTVQASAGLSAERHAEALLYARKGGSKDVEP